jgi:hypothetical protein
VKGASESLLIPYVVGGDKMSIQFDFLVLNVCAYLPLKGPILQEAPGILDWSPMSPAGR